MARPRTSFEIELDLQRQRSGLKGVDFTPQKKDAVQARIDDEWSKLLPQGKADDILDPSYGKALGDFGSAYAHKTMDRMGNYTDPVADFGEGLEIENRVAGQMMDRLQTLEDRLEKLNSSGDSTDDEDMPEGSMA